MDQVSGGWIDISVPVRSGMVRWPGDPPFEIERVCDQAAGDDCTISKITMCAHTGTHIDAPLHYIPNGLSLDQMPPEAMIGPARVIQIRDRVSIESAELMEHAIAPGERILFKTDSSRKSWSGDTFDEDFVYLGADGARYLAERGVRCIGIDYLSVGGFRKDCAATHVLVLEAGIWILEGLDLRGIEPGDYEMICLPLKLTGAEAAPARALLRPL